ncbi:2-dehydropantoate 2-reductase [Rhodopseudomonas boonkerdii]|uniref:2-dehydropantoate 2-reductase n=1 Tax=Rhodopseudomonas boonkerdii TaxID=475937 RepID=UPI001E44B25A|nr:2-dehydropantoate 2-reductase [Rhodopseudomonas boonkerdii]UGV25070.1 2-dehydropantoate 2-reductase [Rhodopseudomonas boonkerdii]
MNVQRPICIAGAGSIGCYVGGMIAAAGRPTSLLGRRRLVDGITRHGLQLTSFEGGRWQLRAEHVNPSDDPTIMADADTIIVAVKSGDTAAMAELIARHAAGDAVVVSLQNGVGNVAILKQALPGHKVLGGMVPFNVVTQDDGTVHRATSGALVIERDSNDMAARLSVANLPVRPTDDIAGVQWGKLLVNLSNALNALSDLPLYTQLQQRIWRLLFADQMAEGLAVLRAAGISPVAATPIPPWFTPHLLRLPDNLFGPILRRVMKIDANARSSMWEDLQRGRPTEIDYLQGVILQLANQYGVATPLSRRVVETVKAAETARQGSPALSVQQIRGL